MRKTAFKAMLSDTCWIVFENVQEYLGSRICKKKIREKPMDPNWENILNGDAILDLNGLDQSTLSFIHEVLSEMVCVFGIKLNGLAVGTRVNIEEYAERYGEGYEELLEKMMYEEGAAKNIVVQMFEAKESIEPTIANAWRDCIFLNRDLWSNEAQGAKEFTRKQFQDGIYKHDSLRGVVLHEYAHVVQYYKQIEFEKKKENERTDEMKFDNKIGELLNSIVYILCGNDQYEFGKRFKEYPSGLLGEGIWQPHEGIEGFWAELIACYFVDKDKKVNEDRILPEEIRNVVADFLKENFKI